MPCSASASAGHHRRQYAPDRRRQRPPGPDPSRGSAIRSRCWQRDTLHPCIRADATLTLALPKTGLLTAAAGPFVGELAVADIGVPADAYARLGVTVGPLFSERSIVRVEE